MAEIKAVLPLVEDGENQALRMFLSLYGGTNSVTTKRMRGHLAAAGYEGCWPEWANEDQHLTKGGAQHWIRHLISLEAAVLSANAGKVDESDIVRNFLDYYMAEALKVLALDPKELGMHSVFNRRRVVVEHMRNFIVSTRFGTSCAPSPTQQAIDEPIDRYGRTAAQERQRQIDNRLLQLIQRFFPSLPVAPGYTDWSHWLRFANEAAKIHASQPLAEVKP